MRIQISNTNQIEELPQFTEKYLDGNFGYV